jgi:Icc-related predicted phosphoesterase
MRIVAIADQHGHLPAIPPCDCLLIAGDICPARDHSISAQLDFLSGPFRAWLDHVPARDVVATWGNHDFIGQESPKLVPRLRWQLLVDRAVEIDGWRIYGTPWQPMFQNWAFNLSEHQLAAKWEQIEHGTEILLCHGPPRGYGDNAPRPGQRDEHVGSPSLLLRIERVRPRLVVFGHVHNGRGQWRLPGVKASDRPVMLVNAVLLDETYQLVHPPVVLDLLRPHVELT